MLDFELLAKVLEQSREKPPCSMCNYPTRASSGGPVLRKAAEAASRQILKRFNAPI